MGRLAKVTQTGITGEIKLEGKFKLKTHVPKIRQFIGGK
jgi:hypothetical protein